MALNRPMRLRASRRSRPFLARYWVSRSTRSSTISSGPKRRLVERATRSSRLAAAWCRPRLVSCSARGVIVGLLGQSVVVGERMRGDAQVADPRVVGQDDRDGRGCLASAGALLEHVRDRLGGDGAALERLGERGLDGGGAVGVEQAREPPGVVCERLAAHGERLEKPGGAGAGTAQTVAAPQFAGAALLGSELLEVSRILDDDAAVVAAAVLRKHHADRVRDADVGLGRDERERLADAVVRD